jgi:hypothetical protein
VLPDRHVQVIGAAVVQKEDTLADTPKRRATELSPCCTALRNSVSQPGPHIVHGEVAQRLERHIVLRWAQFGLARGLAYDMAALAPDIREDLLTTTY